MTYEECVVWLGRYRDARRGEASVRSALRRANARADELGVLRRQLVGQAAADLDGVLLELDHGRQKAISQIVQVEAARREVEGAIAQLDDALEREVLTLRYIDDRTNRQIAYKMRISERYVRKLHRRGVTKILKLVPLCSAPACYDKGAGSDGA
nr:MAG TPA: RNA polymerase sigma factor [Caudoviricetes sp.]